MAELLDDFAKDRREIFAKDRDAGIWSLRHLWTANARCKCRTLLAETVFIKPTGDVDRWLLSSSKSGDVIKKRAATVEMLLSRFGRAWSAQETTCIAYLRNGKTKRVLLSDLGAAFDLCTARAVQTYIPPSGNRVRNLYVCEWRSTGKGPTAGAVEAHSRPVSWDPTTGDQVLGPATKCRALSLRKLLHESTESLATYLQHEMNVVVHSITAHFVMDPEERPWLTWFEAARLEDVSMAPYADPTNSMTEEEEQPALEIDASLSPNLSLNLDTRIKTPNSVASPNASRVRKRPRGGRRRSDERARFGSPRATATDAVALGIQVGHATAHVEDHDASEDLGDVGASGETDVEKAESAASLRAREAHNFTIAGTSAAALDATGAIKINAPPVVDQHYPNPFNCRGDFCDFPVQEPATLYSKAPETVSKRSGQVGLALAKRLFSKNELEAMAMKMGFNMATPQGHEDALEALGKRLEATGPGPDITKRIQHYAKPQYEHYQLPMKSIAMARKEKRGFVASMGVQGGANPSSQKRAPGADTFARPKDRGIEGLDAREHLLEQHGGVPLSHFYEHVTVCPNCYRIYSTLDQARDILEGEAMRRSRREAALRGAARDAAREDLIARLNAKGQQRRALDSREPATRERTRTPSPIRSARRYVQELPELLPNRSTPDLPTRAELREEEDRKAVELAQNLTNAVVKAVEGGACTREEAKRLQAEHESLQKFEDLESYLRGTRERKYNEAASALIAHEANPRSRRAPKSNKAGKRGGHLSLADREKEKERDARRYKGQILLAEEDDDIREQVSSILRDAEYTVTVFSDGPPALEMCRDNYFDLFLTSTLLPSLNGLEVAKLLRKREKKGDPDKQRLPLVALAAETAPEDLRLYMDAGFDGCVSKPVDEVSLLNTVRAAIPRHEPSKSAAKRLARKLGPGGSSTTATSGSADFEVPLTRPTTSGLMTSSDVVKLTLPMPRNNLDEEASSTGVFQMDADTSFPYLVMGEKRSGSRLFNIVVLHDFFDTYETMQIFFRPIVTKYPGLQVLVFNLPGQAFTEWRRDALLNNEYYDHCVDALLRHVDYNGTKELETRGPYATPFYLMGFGNGANIAMQYAARCKPPKMRALLSLNGFSHVDPHLAGILHDCMNVFSCAPATRPDLPVYFYTRFLFSSAYLSKVSTPLALNLYTAVHNPITLEGRMQICKGSLAHADLRDEIKQLDKPIILVQSSQGGLVKPLHVEPVVKLRGGEARSIRQCLKDRSRPCVIWLRSGHELFQECRRPVSDLIEQLCTGYHENHDVAFLPTADDTEAQSPGRSRRPRDSGKRGGVGGATGQPSKFFEDRFIDNVLGTLDKVRQEGSVEANPFAPNSQQQQQLQQQQQQRPGSREAKQSMQSSMVQLNESDDPAENPRAELSRWQNFREETGRRAQGPSAAERNRAAQDAKASRRKDAAAAAAASAAAAADLLFDPTMRNFDWAQKRRKGTDPDSDDEGDFDPRFGGVPARAMKPVEVPEIREYMRWRIARNKKRLAKFVRSACVIQRAWRAFLARTLAEKLRTTRAALLIQSKWRAKLARDELEQRRQEEWAARLVQRCWRGKAGRDLFRERRAQVNAARHMQRIFRGRQGKKRVEGIKQKRRRAAMAIQNMVRAHIARKLTWRLRQQRNAAIDIQRVYRGHRGRGRASLERDKYLFSKAQSQGIDFGRQMLLEHKLHGTRLQSEVSMLTREKVETEEKVEALLSEISEFDKGVRALEKEMHELSAVETEAKGVLDEEARIELREQKMRLDHEFGIMLGKIADRKERLKNLEVKLQTIDRTRQGKEEELRDLERKLVVLLEEQQQELEQIKRRQQTRGELALPETAATALQVGAGGGVGGGAALGGPMASPYAGPTPQQQQQANNMMQSTESLMKFGFMSMSLTYFSSLNMVRAMRKVGALNTVLHGPAGTSAGQAQIQALLSGANGSSAGGKAGDAETGAGDSSGSAGSSGHFRPGFRKGQMPEEQDALTVTTWTVEDVGDWLGTLKLKQYRACFADAAIDGAFLYDLNDDDLRNTLGIEHNLHRKKILSSIVKLRRMEEAHSAQSMSNTSLSGSSLMSIQAVKNSAGGTTMNGSSGSGPAPGMPVVPSVDTMDDTDGRPISAAASLTVHPDKLLSMARHGKVREMREAMQALPDRPFDPFDVTEQYVDSYGTKYSDELGRLQWFINKADEHGNTLMTIAAQNGRLKVAKLLLDKGANVNHQNVQGQTPLHYAMAYNFYELGAWLTDAAEGASANDQLLNMYGLTPYDGLSPE